MHLSLWGVQTLVLTTRDLIYPGRSSSVEVNSADSAVMEIVKSNMIDMVPFQLVKEEDIQLSTFQYDFNIHVSITNSGLTSKSYDFVADVYIDGVLDGFITIPRSGTLDYQGATFFDRNFHFNLPTDLTSVSKLLFTGYFSTYRVTVDADSVTNNAVCQSGVTTEIPINQAYIGGDTANISINVII